MKHASAVRLSDTSSATYEKPILVFDSGIGGLTVLREARVLMPDRRFVYIADDAGFPYGGWEEEALRARIVELFGRFIAEHDPEIAVIACNTASTLVLDDLRHAYPAVPFVGTVPAIKPAAERTSSGLVSVLATPGTVKRAYTRDLIQSFATQCHVRLVGADRLAAVAEAHIRGEEIDEALVIEQITPCFVEKDGERTDIVVLACTHYPFLANVFRRLAPWPVDWLDPAEAIARRTVSLLQPRQIDEELHHHDDLAVFTSQKPDYAIRRLMQGFGLQFA
ncbi:glutamate racemase [Ochrobactrum sp. MYb15]|uniref:glutamate racemase n=1 Tax=Brucella TaxID=234 RepID=UPI000463C729|nr:glutamate racemase [Brucella rhizosphaerae]PQZ51733.1 glutamate racemase [Ochrobactrum sp. MYb19]PRA65233.1 glutamate racemase [Ochrobactrum sp. MYb18]PRA76923.1 glutamate racemase [Brucella thiophenivorans]PRA93443.1 glutamate racemase [Ochrobactrum sp. MYb14]PRA98931.1 glutamate racemase [Ochrobactrum sp. MYb15]